MMPTQRLEGMPFLWTVGLKFAPAHLVTPRLADVK